MRPEICVDNSVKPNTTIQTIHQPTPTQNLEAIIAERLAEERAGMKTETISDYAEAMKQGDQFPPVVVFNDGSNYWLADGFHRIYAARDIGLEEVDAEVREGSIHDARWFAVGANNRHGARPTNEDKRSAVQLALEDEKLSQLSDREIARQCHVSNGFVSRLRRDSSVYGTQSAELLTPETPRQNWVETIQEVIQQEQEKAERRLAEERAGMETTIRERSTVGFSGAPQVRRFFTISLKTLASKNPEARAL